MPWSRLRLAGRPQVHQLVRRRIDSEPDVGERRVDVAGTASLGRDGRTSVFSSQGRFAELDDPVRDG